MQENIDYSSPDDGLGDKLRNAFIKTDNNFTELYNGKVDKITGKGLSENDFTDADKLKLDGIEDGAQVNVNSDFGENDPDSPGYILNKPPAMYASVGYFDYNDLTTQTTPLVLVSGVNKKLTNDTLGVFTDLSQAPYGVATVWNSTTNQFDFSDLAIGDTLDLRVDALLTTVGTNKTYKIFLKLGIGTPSEFTTLVGSGELKAAVTDENIVKELSFYIGNEDVRTGPAELYILVDTSGSVKVNGWYTRIIRKGLNIIDVTGAYLSDDPTQYLDATLPLTGTEVAILNNGTNWVSISWNNIKTQLKTYFDTLYQSTLVSATNIKTINGNSILGSGDLAVGGSGEIRQYFFTHGNKYNLSTIGNYYSSEVEQGLTPTTINNSPGNNLVDVMKTRWVMPIMYSFRSQKLKKVVFACNDSGFTSLKIVLFMGQRVTGTNTRINNVVIHNQDYTINGTGQVNLVEITSFTNDITIPEGYELCFLLSRLNGTGGVINNVQISGYAS